MTATWLNCLGKLLLAIPLALSSAISDRVLAQIIPDRTLGGESSEVTSINPQADRIDGGAIRGTLLFHSFLEFNIGEGRGAYFTNPAAIETIFSRVTGSNPSHLLGTLGVLGEANLFLMNPNGIIFGANAQLDIRGSFVASTANSLTFPDGTHFSATHPEAPPLLTVDVPVPIGLQFETQQSGAIVNAGNLAVESGQNLTLVGGTVTSTGQLSAPSGEVVVLAVPAEMADGGLPVVQMGRDAQLLNISSSPRTQSSLPSPQTLPQLLMSAGVDTGLTVTDTGEVELTGTGIRIPTDAGSVVTSGSIDVSGDTAGRVQVLGDKVGLFGVTINASGINGGGTVLMGGDYRGLDSVLNASRTFVDSDSVINANALTDGDGGRVIVWADETTGFYGNISARGGSSAGNGGFVEVSGKENLIFRGQVDTSAANGNFGTLLLDPRNIKISATEPDTPPEVVGALPDILEDEFAGTDITINANTLESQLGNVVLEATNDITVAPGVLLDFQNKPLITLDSIVFPGGSISFTADADDDGAGSFEMDLGDTIKTNGRTITISGASITTGTIDSSFQFLSVPARAGDITLTANGDIKTNSLNANGLSSPEDTLRTGNIALISRQGSIDTSIGTLNSSSVEGNGGAISLSANSNITTGNLESVSGGSGNGGEIKLTSQNGAIDTNASLINSGSVLSQGGNIILNANSDITMNGATVNSVGAINGGDITLNSTNGEINATEAILNSGSVPQKLIEFASNSNLNIPPTLTQFANGSGNGGVIALSANGDINLTRSIVNASGGSSGAGGSIALTNNTAISLETSLVGSETKSGTGGDINFTTGSVSLTNRSVVVSKALENSQAGDINVTASEFLELNQRSYLATQNQGVLPSGNVTIDTQQLSIQEGSIVSASTDGAGRGGTLTVRASDSVDVAGTADGIPSVLASVSVDKGQAGDVRISTTQLSIRDGGTVSATALDRGSQGGSVRIEADSVLVSGTSENQLPSNLTVDTATESNAGNLEINIRQLIVRDGGVVSASTYDRGRGGSVIVNGAELVELRGTSEDGQFKSGIYAQSFGAGDAGSLRIDSDRIIVEDRARVTVSSNPEFRENQRILTKAQTLVDALHQNIPGLGEIIPERVLSRGSSFGNAGNLEITADTISLNNQGELIAETFSGEGGNISLQVQDLLLMRRNSLISATAGTAPAGGNGGNITINADDGFIIAVPGENSDIRANAFTGNGGRIEITTQAIFGLQFREEDTPLSDFTASSEFGLDGDVNINTLGVDPSRGLTTLPDEPRDSDVAEGCQASEGQDTVEYFEIGRGGTPPRPDEPLQGDTVIADWIELDAEIQSGSDAATATSSSHLADNGQGRGNHTVKASTITSQLLPTCQSH
ncbi:MAG: filamentous hemagglutinin N-terminal domain-containing protein [Coleofasciculus sp. S288]|nr:filamentous hemagglutinin N-terminal domain-containing protein [Coleofasciculus sp. S288]